MSGRRKSRKLCFFLLLALLVTGALMGCGKETEPEKQVSTEKKDTVQIGITFDSFVLERWQRDRDVFVSTAQELGAEVNVQNANGDIKEQIAHINYFIQKKMDVIVIVMVASSENVSEFKECVEKAQKAGISVIAYDRLILDANVDLYISFDNVEVGRLMAEHMKEHLADGGRLLQVCGPMEDYNVPQVMEGFEEVIKDTGLEIVASEHADGWLPETGFLATGRFLKNQEIPDGIMCGNDGIAGQAIRALSESRLAGKVCVVGQDADLDACQRIVEGTQCMTVYKPVEKLARRAAERAVELAHKDKSGIMKLKKTINDGSHEVPYECLMPIMVTKENMDEVITGKYHEESDIYLNIRK